MRSLLVTAAIAVAALSTPSHASTLDFAFLVEQRVATMECQVRDNNLIKIEDAIFDEGKRLGWDKQKTIRELEARRVHELATYRSNPKGYCNEIAELRDSAKHRLRKLGAM